MHALIRGSKLSPIVPMSSVEVTYCCTALTRPNQAKTAVCSCTLVYPTFWGYMLFFFPPGLPMVLTLQIVESLMWTAPMHSLYQSVNVSSCFPQRHHPVLLLLICMQESSAQVAVSWRFAVSSSVCMHELHVQASIVYRLAPIMVGIKIEGSCYDMIQVFDYMMPWLNPYEAMAW